jgi:hypothetical protein
MREDFESPRRGFFSRSSASRFLLDKLQPNAAAGRRWGPRIARIQRIRDDGPGMREDFESPRRGFFSRSSASRFLLDKLQPNAAADRRWGPRIARIQRIRDDGPEMREDFESPRRGFFSRSSAARFLLDHLQPNAAAVSFRPNSNARPIREIRPIRGPHLPWSRHSWSHHSSNWNRMLTTSNLMTPLGALISATSPTFLPTSPMPMGLVTRIFPLS